MSAELLDLMWFPFLMCLVLTGIHAYLGFHVIAREVVFVDIALAQIAALGATAAFLLGYELDRRPRRRMRADRRDAERRRQNAVEVQRRIVGAGKPSGCASVFERLAFPRFRKRFSGRGNSPETPGTLAGGTSGPRTAKSGIGAPGP